MSLKSLAAKAAGCAALAFAVAMPACAQSTGGQFDGPTFAGRRTELTGKPAIEFASYADRQMWHVIFLVSAIVLVAGIADQDTGLIAIGAVGMVISLVESGPPSFRYSPYHPGIALAHKGPLSFGIYPYTKYDLLPGSAKPLPSPFVHYTIHF